MKVNVMMSFERAVAGTFATALTVSSYLAYIRFEDEYTRRIGLNGTSLTVDVDGLAIEYMYAKAEGESERPTLVLENGLGTPLESWDWIAYLLRDNFNVLRYHRRGYWRTKSVDRPARILKFLLDRLAPSGPLVLCGHSFGSLSITNALAESAYLRARTRSVFVLDGTDAVLLAEERNSKRRVGRYDQELLRHLLSSVTGTNRWVPSPVERDIEYRPDIQRSYLVSFSSPQLLLAARREYLNEPTTGQQFLHDLDIARHVISAANNVQQQEILAHRLGADFAVVPASRHRSLIGRLSCAEQVAEFLRKEA